MDTAPEENGKKVLTMTPDICRILFIIAFGVILKLIWEEGDD